jgi:hypothetical protein
MNGANNGTVFTDNSPTPKATTAVGGAITSTTTSIFSGSSGYFNGVDSAVVIAESPDLNLGNGAFTIEFWIYVPTTGVNNSYGGIIASNPPSYSANTATLFKTASHTVALDGPLIPSGAIATVTPGVWEYLAVTRSGNTVRTFKNGTLVNTYTWTSASEVRFSNTGVNTTIGYGNVGFGPLSSPAANQWVHAYLAELRITKGFARYTASFTAPEAPFPDISCTPACDAYYSYDALLLNMDGANGGTTFTDASPVPKTATATDAVTTTSTYQFGTASGSFNQATSEVTFPISTSPTPTWLDFGSADWTIECWVKLGPSTSGDQYIFDTGNVRFGYRGGAPTLNIAGIISSTSSGGGLSTTVWKHFAFVRYGAVYTCYLNGVITWFSYTDSPSGVVNNPAPTDLCVIGNNQAGDQPFYGYIDEFRITKGFARYTAEFTPPTQAFPSIAC